MTLLGSGPAGGEVLAHGIGGAQDLPISPSLAIAGASAALVVSFTVLAVAWRVPRYPTGPQDPALEPGPGWGRWAPRWLAAVVDHPAYVVVVRVVGLLLAAYTAMVAFAGQDLLTNPLFGIFYVWLWVGLVPASLLLGPFWRAISPVRSINVGIARLTRGDPEVGVLTYPERLGHWPAALGLLAFVWMELVYPYSTEQGPVRVWLAAYVALMLVGGVLFGEVFFARADPFEVFSTLVARLSVWGRADGRLVVRSPLANLATTPPRAGLVAVVAVLFGSTAFDSFQDSPRWVQFIQGHPALGSTGANVAVNSLALAAFCLVVGGLFWLGTTLTGVGPDLRRRRLPALLAHSVVPIVVGYFVAHYLSYFVQVGQATLIQASDPFGTGADWFGTADLGVSYWFSYHPTVLAVVKVLAVVLGHVVGVVAAHDRAIALLPRRHQLTGQLPLLLVMVAFTAGGIYLLFSS